MSITATPLSVRPVAQTRTVVVVWKTTGAIVVIDESRGHAVYINDDRNQYDYLNKLEGGWTREAINPEFNVVFDNPFDGPKTVVEVPMRRYTNRHGDVAWHWSAREAIDLARAAREEARKGWYTVG